MADGVVDGTAQAPISVISAPPTTNQEGEMDALLLGRTKVKLLKVFIYRFDRFKLFCSTNNKDITTSRVG